MDEDRLWMKGIWVSFETFFFIWNQYSSKRHTRQFHTRALHIIKTEWSQFSIVTVISGVIEKQNKVLFCWAVPQALRRSTEFFSTIQLMERFKNTWDVSVKMDEDRLWMKGIWRRAAVWGSWHQVTLATVDTSRGETAPTAILGMLTISLYSTFHFEWYCTLLFSQ